MARVLDGRAVARERNARLKEACARLSRAPSLVVVMVGDDPGSEVYVAQKARVAARIGIESRQLRFPGDLRQEELLEVLAGLNQDPLVDGILVQLPLPGTMVREDVLDAVDPHKDVDGFHPENVGLLAQGRPRFVPCTPAGVIALLEAHGVLVKGRDAVVVGRSPVVGRPLSLLLDRAGATVTVCHSATRDLEAHVRRAEILVVAMGKLDGVPARWIPPGAVVVDVGTNRAPDGSLAGDVGQGPELQDAEWVSPVPGGVGPMTISMLMENTFVAARRKLSSPPTP